MSAVSFLVLYNLILACVGAITFWENVFYILLHYIIYQMILGDDSNIMISE